MVDALIKASEEQKCASAEPLSGAGRDLVPFDFDAHNTNDDHNKNNSSTPLLVGVDPRLRAHQVCAPQVPTGGHAAAAAKLSNSAPLEKNGHHTKGNNSNPNKGKNKNNSNNTNGHEPKYAGASFTNSPDPDVVPLPSFLKTMPGAQATMAKENILRRILRRPWREFSTDDIQRGQRDAEFALPFAAFTTAAAAHDWQSFTRKYARRRYSYAAATLSTTTADDTKHFE